jgi:hypothetical protein
MLLPPSIRVATCPETQSSTVSILKGRHIPGNGQIGYSTAVSMCCSMQTLFCHRRHQRRLGTPTLETNPHTLALDLHGGRYGHLHAWKIGSTGCGDDHGCFGRSDAGHRSFHCGEGLCQHSTLSPQDGAEQAAFSYDQHFPGKTVFQTSHAGKEISLTTDTIRCSMGAPEFSLLLIVGSRLSVPPRQA